ncbi:MAG: hypothetical protein JXA74_02525, partial [Anaerolineae bacterium]|nr:hypothetical protein [Anaerolineae bacterium]
PRMDREMAGLFEAYYTEIQGEGLISEGPPMHRVLPVGEAVPAQIDILPYQSATYLLEHARAWACWTASAACSKSWWARAVIGRPITAWRMRP